MAEPVRHRQTKEAATDMFDLQPPRHISTLPIATLPQDPMVAPAAGCVDPNRRRPENSFKAGEVILDGRRIPEAMPECCAQS